MVDLARIEVEDNPLALLAQADELASIIECKIFQSGPAEQFFDRTVLITFLALQLLEARHPLPEKLFPLIRGGHDILAYLTQDHIRS
jgi:hypothetical protein